MSYNSKVKCGVSPLEDDVKYEITTVRCAKFIEDEIRCVEKTLREVSGNDEIPHVVPKLTSAKIGKRFYPFILLLSSDVLQDRSQDEDIPDIFLPDNDSVFLKKSYNLIFQRYRYSKEDINSFRSNQFKHDSGVFRNQDIQLLCRYAYPKVETNKVNGKENSFVVMILDPIRLFHHMLVDDLKPKQQFRVFIQDVDNIDGENFRYTVLRSVNKKNNTDTEALQQLLTRKMREYR